MAFKTALSFLYDYLRSDVLCRYTWTHRQVFDACSQHLSWSSYWVIFTLSSSFFQLIHIHYSIPSLTFGWDGLPKIRFAGFCSNRLIANMCLRLTELCLHDLASSDCSSKTQLFAGTRFWFLPLSLLHLVALLIHELFVAYKNGFD